eukprot:2702786-Alexandrium_andersonii.AAC.1
MSASLVGSEMCIRDRLICVCVDACIQGPEVTDEFVQEMLEESTVGNSLRSQRANASMRLLTG